MVNGESTALDTEALARLHLQEEANFSVHLREDPDAKKVVACAWVVQDEDLGPGRHAVADSSKPSCAKASVNNPRCMIRWMYMPKD